MANFFREMLSEKGVASSKRVLGGICLLSVLGVWGYVTVIGGLGEHETSLAEMIVGVSCVLLGITSVANIFTSKNERDRAVADDNDKKELD